MLIKEKIQIKIVPQNIEHYKSLGYDCSNGQLITIDIEDLAPTSKRIEKRICDCCGAEYSNQHNYNLVTFNSYNKDVCKKCLKTAEFKQIRRAKVESTNLLKYGVKAPLQNKEIQDKQKKTMLLRYGVEYPALSKEIMNKVKDTNQKRYGGDTPMSDNEVVQKIRQTLYENNMVPTSSQQRKIKEMLETIYPQTEFILNYPESKLSLDIFFIYKNIKIDVEYDGSYWHNDSQKDRRRDEVLKSLGYKILRIRSGHKIPEQKQLKEAINDLINSEYSFKEIMLSDWKNNINK